MAVDRTLDDVASWRDIKVEQNARSLTMGYDETNELLRTARVDSNGNLKTGLVSEDGNTIGVQHPLPTDGDSIYAKDINTTSSDIGDFSGAITDLFDDIGSNIADSSATNPKEITIALKRPMDSSAIKICTDTGDFSNVKIILKDAAGTVKATIDDSSNDTKYTSKEYITSPVGFCTMIVQFHTADAVTLGFMLVFKAIHTHSQLMALKPDGTSTFIDATNGGNLKMSLEELESGISSNSNSQLNTTQFDSSGNEVGVVQNVDDTTNIDGTYGQVTSSMLYGRVDGTKAVPIRIDGSTHSIQTVDYGHHEVHSGDAHITCAYDNTMGNSDTLIIAFTTTDSTKWAHMLPLVTTKATCIFEILEAPTITNGSGTEQATYDRNRNTDNPSVVVNSIEASPVAGEVSVNPTITADGTAVWMTYISSGNRSGGSNRSTGEIILKQNTTYAFRVTALEATNGAGMCLEWYEHTDKN